MSANGPPQPTRPPGPPADEPPWGGDVPFYPPGRPRPPARPQLWPPAATGGPVPVAVPAPPMPADDAPPVEWALWYAARLGWRAVPLHHLESDGTCSCTPFGTTDSRTGERIICRAGSPGKHPRPGGWEREATTDPAQIAAWWRRWPRAGVGVVTGRESAVVVVDLDARHGGEESLDLLEARHGRLPATVECLTGGGGRHLYFAHPGPGVPIANLQDGSLFGGGVDIRGDGGFAVAPPTLHASGRRYTWEWSSGPDTTPLAPLPDWLLRRLTGPRPPAVAAARDGGGPAGEPGGAGSGGEARPRLDTAAVLGGVPDGRRHVDLFRLASKLRWADVPQEVAERLVTEAGAKCAPPLAEREAVAQARSAYGRYPPGPSVSPYEKNEKTKEVGVSSFLSFFSSPKNTPTPWPSPLGAAAYHGLAGAVVRAYGAESEADPAALLFHFLVAFGATVGRGPTFFVGPTAHPAAEFVLVAGRSAKARKGDGWQAVRRLFGLAQPGWERAVVTTGLSTGEGLIHEVRDARGDAEAGGVDDPGVLDKRRCVVEGEFSRVLRVGQREGNTLSATLRNVWDGVSPLKTLTRGKPEAATGAHIGIVAHTTIKELRTLATATDAASGYLNRFLCVAVTRAQLLPSPRAPDPEEEAHLAGALAGAVAAARRVGAMTRTPAAEAVWRRAYAQLAGERDGLAGDLLARGEAHVLRLSMLYALLDGTGEIDTPHLEAALELWRFVEESTTHVYGDATGDAVADTLLAALAPGEPLTMTEVSALYSRNVPAARIRLTVESLEAAGRLRTFTAPEPGKTGRPTTFVVRADPDDDRAADDPADDPAAAGEAVQR